MPAPYSAGSIFLQVAPSFRGVPEQIAREARDWGDDAGKGFDERFEKAAVEGAKKTGARVGKELGDATKDAGAKAGDDYTGTFRTSLRKGIASAQRELNTTPLKLAYNDDGLRKTLDKVRKDFKDLDRQVKLGLDAGGSLVELRRILGVLDSIKSKAQNVELRSNVGKVHADLVGIEAHIQKISSTDIEPKLKIDRQLGVFERRLKAGIKSALDDLPSLTLDDGPAYAQVEALRERLHSLDRDIELGMDSGQLFAELTTIEGVLHSIADTGETMKLRVDAASVFKTVTAVRTELESLSRMTIKPEIELDRQMGAFERGFRGAIDNALRDLGTIDQKVTGTTLAERSVRDLRKRLFDLGDLSIGIDISAETAREELRRIRDDLEQLQREHWSVDIDADAAAASAQISGFLAALDAVDHEDIDVDVELKGIASAIAGANALRATLGQTDSVLRRLTGNTQDGANSFRAFNIRILGVAALGPLVVPALAAIGAGILALGPMAMAAAAGIGVLGLALFGVGDAFKAMGEARTNSAKEMGDYSKGVRTAANGVADAERAVADARVSAARASESAGRQVEGALRGVESAERNLQDAQENAASAQRDLQRAREDAAEQLQDLELQARGGALAERDAVLDLKEAEETLVEVRKEGLKGDDLERYILKVDQARFNLDRTRESNEDLTAEQEKWAKTGIEGSDGVIAAHERVQEAQESIAEAERGMADAQRALADARVEQARTAADGQKQIADAQRNLAEAQVAYGDALATTTASQDKLKESMAKLGPAGQDFVKFLDGLRPRFEGLRAIAQAGLLPGLTDWIDSMVTYHGPLLEKTVGNISGAVGRMFSSFGESIRGPAFTDLFEMINDAGPTFIRQMGDILVNLGEGVAGLIVAMEPLSRFFGEHLVNATRRFNEWANNLRGSTGLQDFFTWVERVGPKVADFFWEFGDALLAIGKAVAPFAERMLVGLTDFLDWVSELDPNLLGPIVIGLLGITVGLQAIFGLTALMHQFRSALHLTVGSMGAFSSTATGLKGAAGSFGIISVAMGTLYTQSEAARGAIDGIFEALGHFVGWVTGWMPDLTMLATTLALVAASWKLASVVGDGIGKLGAAATNAAPGFGVFTTKVTGSDKAGMGAMTTMGKLGGALGVFGRILPVVGIGLGLLGAAFEVHARAVEKSRNELVQWMQARDQGGSAGAEANRNLQEHREKIDAAREALEKEQATQRKAAETRTAAQQGTIAYNNALETTNSFTTTSAQRQAAHNSELEVLEGNLAAAEREYKAMLDTMSPLQIAQEGVSAAQADLQMVLKDHAPTSDEAKAASERLEAADRRLAIQEGDLALAASGVNLELLKRQQLAIDVAAAQMTYEQSVGALKDAHQRYLDVLKDPEATEEQARQAMEAWHNQALNTAESAKALTEAKYRDADANVRTQMGNAALLLDLERQKSLYGDLPPVLEDLRQSLSETVPEPYKVAAAFENLGLEIAKVPDKHTIVLESATDEEIIKMQELGLIVERGADGTVTVTANTDEARAAIEALTAPRTLEIKPFILPRKQNFSQKNDGRTYYGQVPEFASGGFIRGAGTATSDSIPAYLSNGEYVVRAASVAKYGLGLLDAINHGKYGTGFATGGLASTPRMKNGRLAFAEGGAVGGYSAQFGGTMDLSGLAIPELAQWWTEAVTTVSTVSARAASAISQTFGALRGAVLRQFGETHTEATSIWGRMMSTLTGQTSSGAGILGMLFGQIRDNTTTRSNETGSNVGGIWGRLRDSILGRATEARDWTNSRFSELRDNLGTRAWEAVQRVLGHFNGMPGSIANPVNKIIDAVLNNGLFKAFNSVVGALGLGDGLRIPPATQVKLATGGRVPGHSPHAKADNIPAMLTAGEWVQPVDSVQYYGADFMEAIRKKRIPREALGMDPIRRANGGLVELGRRLQSMGARVTEHPAFGGVAMGGHGKTSLHYSGHALDVNTRAGTSALEQRELAPMEKLARSLGFRTIFMAPGHFNHLHIDDGGGKSILGALGGLLGGAMDLLSDPVGALRKAVDGALGNDFDGGVPIRKIMSAGARKMVELMTSKVTGWVGQFFDDGNDAVSGKASNAGNEALVRSMAAARGWGGGEWEALRTLIMKESGFNSDAQNPTSTAFGMFQFLNSTWAGVGARKTSDPRLQTEAGFKYIASRYGTPSRALAFHRRNNWYGDGGEVTPNQGTDSGSIVPDLHDNGGWLQPGLNVLMNRTGKPEAVINPQTMEALLSVAEQGKAGASSAIGTLVQNLHQGATAREVAGAVDHVATVARRGGKY